MIIVLSVCFGALLVVALGLAAAGSILGWALGLTAAAIVGLLMVLEAEG